MITHFAVLILDSLVDHKFERAIDRAEDLNLLRVIKPVMESLGGLGSQTILTRLGIKQ